ncbi:MAG: hypothetical protein CVU10_04310 [Bacteroidetes bacterium HGW-Bacteroidetes-5]|jgi:hypothetical protein|nr:MAG: hypothetical protein CVU10_04310 [Bacteroidetes bacterium HGW-Bacteroidetes-5]
MAQDKKKILSDHKQVGKKLLPPFLNSFPRQLYDSPYLCKVLPEIIWQGFLNDKYGIKNSVDITLYLLHAIHEATKLEKGKLFCFISNYEILDEKHIDKIRSRLFFNNNYKKFLEAIQPFISVFPECPLRKIFYNKIPEYSKKDLQYVKNITKKLLNNDSKETTLILANTFYFANQMGVLHLTKDSCLLNMDEVINYPDTGESKKIASFLRASINPFVGNDIYIYQNSMWSKYFWNRAYQLEPFNVDNLYFS